MSGLTFVEIGATFGGRYRLEGCIGGGDDRAVYEAVDESRGGRCALEVMTAEALPKDARAELAQRIEQLREIDHPQLAIPFHAGTNNALDLFFVACPLLDGVDLGAIARQSGPVPPEQVVTWIRSAATALTALHEGGHTHGQLAPSSLFLDRDDDGKPLIVISDLGKHGLVTREACDENDICALATIAASMLGADQSKVKLPNAFGRWMEKVKDDGFESADAAAEALAIALGVREGDDGENRQIVDYDEQPELGETLRPEDLEDAADEAKAAAAKTLIDPLGDTQATGLEKAADDAIAEARASAPERPKIPIAETVEMTPEEKEEMLASDLPPLPTKRSPVVPIIIVVVVAAIIVAVATMSR